LAWLIPITFALIGCDKDLIDVPSDGSDTKVGYIWAVPTSGSDKPMKYNVRDGGFEGAISDFAGGYIYGAAVNRDTGESFYVVRFYEPEDELRLFKYSAELEKEYDVDITDYPYVEELVCDGGGVWSYANYLSTIIKFSGADGSLLIEKTLDMYIFDMDVFPGDGSVWLAGVDTGNWDNYKLVKLTSKGDEILAVELEREPDGVTVDQETGNVWVVFGSFYNGGFYKFSSAGVKLLEVYVDNPRSITPVPMDGGAIVGCSGAIKRYDGGGELISEWLYFGARGVITDPDESVVYIQGYDDREYLIYAFDYETWTEVWWTYKPGLQEFYLTEK
jgi:hypothetical protein